MASKIKLTIVKGSENRYKIQLSYTENGITTIEQHNAITGAELRTSSGLVVADSDTQPSLWDFTNPDYLTCQLGLSDIPAGIQTCRLLVKDAVDTIGIAWDTDIILTVLP